MDILEILRIGPVIPVIVVERAAEALPLARALLAGGVKVFEVTLRTPAALEAVRSITNDVEGAVVGVGTVTRPHEFELASQAGARFAVSPGATPELYAAARASRLPWLPGAMTPSDALAARDAGYRALKFFPAQSAGGIELLKALYGPLPDLLFCPTGGVTAANAAQYLLQPNVACVGGSWLAPVDAVEAGDWPHITALARQASALPRRAVPPRVA